MDMCLIDMWDSGIRAFVDGAFCHIALGLYLVSRLVEKTINESAVGGLCD